MRRFGFEGVILVVWKGETPPPPGGGFPLEERLLGMGRDGENFGLGGFGMNMEQVALLFGLFAGPDVVAEEYTPILTMAVQEVRQGLLPDVDETDARLCYLAAAVALLRYTEMTAARDRAACTFAGTIAQNTDAKQKRDFALSLVWAYRGLCRSLLEEGTFFFAAV